MWQYDVVCPTNIILPNGNIQASTSSWKHKNFEKKNAFSFIVETIPNNMHSHLLMETIPNNMHFYFTVYTKMNGIIILHHQFISLD